MMSELADALVRQVNALEARAEKAEREIQSLLARLTESECTNSALRQTLNVIERERDEERAKKETFACAAEHYCKERDDETMCEFVARLVATVKELRSDLLRASLGVCKSCEGPLTCAKCVPVVPESQRIVELQGMLTERELYSRQNHDLIATLTQVNNELRETIHGLDDHEARIKALVENVNAMGRRLASVEFNAPAKVHCGTCGKDREVECTDCNEERRV
jgi:DNA repair exonuclease SbcCD ATPase subunit